MVIDVASAASKNVKEVFGCSQSHAARPYFVHTMPG
jgi:hypothetical protein